MKPVLDKIIVCDIETTCWEKGKEPRYAVVNCEKCKSQFSIILFPGEISSCLKCGPEGVITIENGPQVKTEIIEIGICLLDIKTKEVTENKGFLITPENTTVSKFCENLTTITQKMLDETGKSLVSVLSSITEIYKTPRRVWASYGFFDKNHVSQECYEKKIRYPFSQRHINIKTLFAVKRQLSIEVGLAKALDLLQLKPVGIHHRGGDDANNGARILATLL